MWWLVVTSRWPLLNLGFLGQRSNSQCHWSSKPCLINNLRTHWPRILILGMVVNHACWIWDSCVKGQGRSQCHWSSNIVWLIAWDHIDLGSLDLVWCLDMTSRWVLLNLRFVCQRSRSQWHCSSKPCLINNLRTRWPRIFRLGMVFGHD